MAARELDGEMVAEGSWLYGEVPCRLAIIRRNTRYGTGDHEDQAKWADDQERETFELLFALPGPGMPW
jgi:hypothetical protein